MKRGTVSLNNIELGVLHGLAVLNGCNQQALLNKLTPVENVTDQMQEHTVLVSEDEVEILLDCMPIQSHDLDQALVSARVKLQQFLAKSRFDAQS